MRALLDALSQPDRAYPIVHIAGSKGKGSTAAFAAAIGDAAGYRTGLSTSPHLHSFRERIAISGQPIDQETFAVVAQRVEVASSALEQSRPDLGTVTAFEFLTAMGLQAFADANCDLAIVEVGLGGTFDSTNVVTPDVSVITRLDLEHTQVLGDTLAEIAVNKAGIIKAGIPAITAMQPAEALDVITRVARSANAPLSIAQQDFQWAGDWESFSWRSGDERIDNLRTGLPGNHQMENASLAIAAWHVLTARGLSVSEEQIRAGVARATLPGRFERIERDGRSWILDGAHTPASAAALADALLTRFGRPVGVIVGMLRDKHPAEFFQALAPAIAHAIVTAPHNPRAIPAEELSLASRTVDSQTIIREDIDTALVTARAHFPGDLPIAITGSFTLVAEARERLGLALPDA